MKMNYKKLCGMLNVRDKDIKDMLEEEKNQTESERFGFDWIANTVNPGCKLTASELGQVWESLNWANHREYPKYYELSTIASMLFCYRVNVLNESFTK